VGIVWRWRLALAVAAFVLCELWAPTPAWAFPPYRSTDADTAEEGVVEVRGGLLGIERESQKNAYFSPLLRANLGLPYNAEFVSELEYRADESEVTDAAVGLKWVPLRRGLNLGVEVLLLLPVSGGEDWAGVECVGVATFRRSNVLLHIDAGGFYDPRPEATEKGWKAGAIVEIERGRLRPGLEVFAKHVKHERLGLQAGPGIIVDLGLFDVRAGLRVGVTREAPDLELTIWITTKVRVWKPR
jgi:hypothetical protein